ncbi:unnamed protein product [Sympodiomycopsis kandeliae]
MANKGQDSAVQGARSESVVVSENKKSGVATSLSLHPLPILNISEHVVRATLQESSQGRSNARVFGVLLGTQTGKDIEIHNTFEMKVNASAGDAGGSSSQPQTVDQAFLKSRLAMFKQTFPTFDFLGWYSNGTSPSSADMAIHRQLIEYNEAPLLLQISPSDSSLSSSSKAGELPVQLYESQIEVKTESSTEPPPSSSSSLEEQGLRMSFVKSSYTIQTGEAERIAVDYTSRPSDSGAEGDAGTLVASLTTQQSAIRMLAERIQVTLQYVSEVRKGNIQRDHETMRRIKSVLASMPAMDSTEFKQEFLKEYNDVMLTSYLSSLTKGLQSLNELVDKFDVVDSVYRSNTNRLGGPERRSRR